MNHLDSLFSRLSIEDIEILELAAQYALGGNLIVSPAGRFVVTRNLSYEALAYLEERGIAMNSRIPLVHHSIGVGDAAAGGGRNGLWLAGHQFGLHLDIPNGQKSRSVSFVELTDLGRKLIGTTRRPTNLNYLCQGDYRPI